VSSVEKPPVRRRASGNGKPTVNQADFARYKDDVKREGKPFFPHAMLHDTIMSLVVVGVIIGLTCVWYYTAGDTDKGEGLDAGILGPWYAEKADPGAGDEKRPHQSPHRGNRCDRR